MPARHNWLMLATWLFAASSVSGPDYEIPKSLLSGTPVNRDNCSYP